jgi:nitrous oxide reductase accessory protein NosL
MFAAKFPEWVSSILYPDGVARHFDGPKDMFKYLLDLSKYEPQRQAGGFKAIVVTEYYGLRRIDARQAFFVIGSDVLGPMGHELIPLASDEEAQEFLKDHKGSHALRFDQIDTRLLNMLDEGKFK